ncbi:polysaccharide biosynthesis C-terminal domain-containing protein [Actinomycetospora cinnamomea]|uniref:oligosaccharide flippase family protein n=1 Tax=Actinomycetospora cinnamomea TaxID=663609 RepID=UPI001403C552
MAARSTDTLAEFGSLAAVQVLQIASPALSDFGVNSIATRAVAQREGATRTILRSALRCRIATFPLVLSPWLVALLFLPTSLHIYAALLFVSAVAQSFQQPLIAIFQGRFDFRRAAMAPTLARAATVALSLTLALIGSISLTEVLAVTICADLGALAYLLHRALRVSRNENLPGHSTLALLISALPLGIGSLLQIAYNKLDVVWVSLAANDSVAGLYAPASRIQDAVATVSSILAAGLLATAARRATGSNSAKALLGALHASVVAGWAILVPLGLTFSLFSDELCFIVLGRVDQSASVAISIIVWAALATAVSTPATNILIADGRVKIAVWANVATAAFALALTVSLIPKYGAAGAAWTAVAREAFLAAFNYASVCYPKRREHDDA